MLEKPPPPPPLRRASPILLKPLFFFPDNIAFCLRSSIARRKPPILAGGVGACGAALRISGSTPPRIRLLEELSLLLPPLLFPLLLLPRSQEELLLELDDEPDAING